MDAIAELAGTTLDWISKGRGPAPKIDELRRVGEGILGVAGVLSIADAGPFPQSVRVYGQAAGSTLDSGALLLFDQEPIGTLPMLPGLQGLRDVYALEVTGDSMLPMFAPKDPVYVSPHSPVRKDDPMIVIEHHSRNGNPTAFIKLMVANRKTEVIGRQLNPAAEIRFQKQPGVTVHKVLSLREAIGYSGIDTEPQTLPPLRFRRGPKN
jgi:phage repressor protein C with HTH and peptisase S24 domain